MPRSRSNTNLTHHPYIAHKKSISGGKPIIKGTRIKVEQIVIEYEHMGRQPDEILQAHPHLNLPQIHDALSYYYENANEINASIRANEQWLTEMKQKYSSGVMEK